MSRLGKIVWFFVAFWGIICLTVIAVTLSALLPSAPLGEASPLGLVTIEGELFDGGPVIEQMRILRDDVGVKGIVIRVESPGGSVAAAQEIFQELEAMRADSFPVVASYGNIAASGGFYATLPAERIFANSGSLTGSIGVITQFMHGEKLMEKLGIEATSVTSGLMKDAGSPYRTPSPQDLQYFQNVVDDTYLQFLEAVSTWRKIPIDSLKPLADGRVFTGRMAQKAGLVDSLGSMQSAVAWLSTRCGLDEVPKSLETSVPPKAFFEELMQGVQTAIPPSVRNRAKVLWMTP
jgi:protease-4